MGTAYRFQNQRLEDQCEGEGLFATAGAMGSYSEAVYFHLSCLLDLLGFWASSHSCLFSCLCSSYCPSFTLPLYDKILVSHAQIFSLTWQTKFACEFGIPDEHRCYRELDFFVYS